ncbi:MAG TPA: ABC transporter substrate-binding protein [Acetobacteraceae bacterium]
MMLRAIILKGPIMLRTLLLAGAAVLSLSAAQAKTLVYCSEGSPENFNPQLNTTGTTFDATHPVYGRLVEFKPASVEIEPGLAERWDVSEDGKTVTFHLRHGVKWQSSATFKPTREFNADDVLFSFNRMAREDHPYHKVSGGSYDYWGDLGLNTLVESMDKVDDYTVRIALKTPNAPFVSDMAMEFASILSAEYGAALMKAGHPEQIDQVPVGTGPFSFVAYQRDATVRYRRFDDFWGEKAHLDALVFSINKDPAVRLAKLRANECQVSAYPAPADLPGIRADPALQLMDQPGLNIGYLAFNVTKKPFDDKRVRQAINMAIDRKAILDAVYLGAGEPARNLIPPTVWSWDKDVPFYPFDPAAAKKLLADAGLPDGFETELWAMPVQRPYNPDARRIGELMQADLAKVGIKARIVSYEWGEYRKRVQQAEHTMAELGWTGDNGDPDNFFVPLSGCAAARIGGGSSTKWCNKQFDDLVNKAVTLTDKGERTKLYEQAQVLMHEEAPFFLIAHSVAFQPMRKEVLNYQMSPFGRHTFDRVDLK